jgi:hypothetical protein
LGITEAEAAAAFGITLRTYRRWEAGKVTVLLTRHVLPFAHKYEVNLDWLVCGDGAGLKPHLTKCSGGKLAILPVMNAEAIVA